MKNHLTQRRTRLTSSAAGELAQHRHRAGKVAACTRLLRHHRIQRTRRVEVDTVQMHAACGHDVPFGVAAIVRVDLVPARLPRREAQARVVEEGDDDRWRGLGAARAHRACQTTAQRASNERATGVTPEEGR